MKDNIITKVVENGFCSGCGLCCSILNEEVENKYSMLISKDGYLRPDIDAAISHKNENIISNACPGMKMKHPTESLISNYHPIWGPLISVHTGNAIDPEVHYKGSSGGVISALCNYLLEKKIVNFVAQISVSQTDPIINEIQISKTRDDILKAAGSRYAPSAPLERIKELLSTGQKFAFVGKPCDIAALRQYGQYDHRVSEQVLYMFSFMCAGVPSLKGTHALLEKMGADINKLKSFRYRGDGWPGMAKAIHHNGEFFQTDYNSSWGTVLNRYLQFRCKICPDGTGEFADIVCADAWYGKNGYPDFTERDGRSLILSRTIRGKDLLEKAINHAISVTTLDVDEVAYMQPYQVNRKKVVLARLVGTWLARMSVTPRYWNLKLVKNTFTIGIVELFKSVVGTFLRAKGEKIEK